MKTAIIRFSDLAGTGRLDAGFHIFREEHRTMAEAVELHYQDLVRRFSVTRARNWLYGMVRTTPFNVEAARAVISGSTLPATPTRPRLLAWMARARFTDLTTYLGGAIMEAEKLWGAQEAEIAAQQALIQRQRGAWSRQLEAVRTTVSTQQAEVAHVGTH